MVGLGKAMRHVALAELDIITIKKIEALSDNEMVAIKGILESVRGAYDEIRKYVEVGDVPF